MSARRATTGPDRPPFEYAYDACVAHLGSYFDIGCSKPFGDQLGSLEFKVSQLRMSMNTMA